MVNCGGCPKGVITVGLEVGRTWVRGYIQPPLQPNAHPYGPAAYTKINLAPDIEHITTNNVLKDLAYLKYIVKCMTTK